MKRTILTATALLFCLVSSNVQGWRGIRPLHSTRQEVEEIIGSPMQPNGITYDLKGERVSIGYAGAPCTQGWPYGWNVPANTVTHLTIHYPARPHVSELAIDLSQFKKYIDPSGFVHYTDDEKGLSVEVDPNDDALRVVEYFPAASDDHLRCPEAAERERQIERGEGEYRFPNGSYYASSPHKESVHLDVFGELFQKSAPDAIVYIIGYAGRRAKVGESLARASRAKAYLSKNLKIDPKQILVIDGGHRDPAGWDLFITGAGKPKPLSTPSIYPDNVEIITNSSRRRVRRKR